MKQDSISMRTIREGAQKEKARLDSKESAGVLKNNLGTNLTNDNTVQVVSAGGVESDTGEQGVGSTLRKKKQSSLSSQLGIQV